MIHDITKIFGINVINYTKVRTEEVMNIREVNVIVIEYVLNVQAISVLKTARNVGICANCEAAHLTNYTVCLVAKNLQYPK